MGAGLRDCVLQVSPIWCPFVGRELYVPRMALPRNVACAVASVGLAKYGFFSAPRGCTSLLVVVFPIREPWPMT